MRKEIPFLPVESPKGTVFRPLISLRLEYRGKTRTRQFLVDSGADFSLLSREFAQEQGMDFGEGTVREVSGIHGHKIKCVEKKVQLTVPGFEKSFESTIYIAKEMHLVHNLLGRDNFFIQYRVGFDQKERKLILDDRKG